MSDISVSCQLKTCKKCGSEKPATNEHFYKDKTKKDGFHVHCRDCQRAYATDYRSSRRDEAKARSRSWHAANREYANKRSRAYYLAHKDRHAELGRKWRTNNRERAKETNRAWHLANPERWKASNWRRRSLIRQSKGTLTAVDIKSQYKSQKGKCYYCHSKVGDNYHIEHVIPLSRGGSNSLENIVIACPACNLSKKDKLPHEWPQGGRLL